MFQPIVVDNFFPNPDEVRKIALEQKYYPKETNPAGGNWPGKRTDYISVFNMNFFKYFMQEIYKHLGLPPEKSSYVESFFQYCSESDGTSWVHRDDGHFTPTHVGVIYLSPNPPPHSGTILYEHKDPDYVKDDPKDDSGDPNDYNIKQVIENKYNRVVIYHPDEFHKSDTYFGTTKEDSRLFIVFFMRVD